MRMSCNGCRVLRKGCSENCSIRPCLQWIKNPESQANATVFLAKFYGRAGLMNLINAGPEHHRPAIFRSLLYEACGRIVNPIYGSVGLLWSGSWQMCQAAVEAVLKGAPIRQIPFETAASSPSPPLKAYDIRHVAKDETGLNGGPGSDVHKVSKTSRTRFKRSGTTTNSGGGSDNLKSKRSHLVGDGDGLASEDERVDMDMDSRWSRCYPPAEHQRAPSRESSASHESAVPSNTNKVAQEGEDAPEQESKENESIISGDTGDASMVTAEQDKHDGDVELELTLGFEPLSHSRTNSSSNNNSGVRPKQRCDKQIDGWDSDSCRVDLALDLSA